MRIKAEGLNFAYHKERVIDNVSIQLEEKRLVSLCGPNGCGKSTLLKLLAGMLKAQSGSILVDGKPVAEYKKRDLAKRLAFLPQSEGGGGGFSVKELIELGRSPHLGFTGSVGKRDKEKVRSALEAMQLSGHEERALHTLSGGEQQRVWLAQMLAQEAELLLLDEPTTYLDVSHQLSVLQTIKQMNTAMGKSVIMVLHDINMAARFSDKIYLMKEGQVVCSGRPEEVINEENLREVFSIRARVFRDETHGCPYFIAIGVV